jgi:hypothetical protein
MSRSNWQIYVLAQLSPTILAYLPTKKVPTLLFNQGTILYLITILFLGDLDHFPAKGAIFLKSNPVYFVFRSFTSSQKT